MLSLERDVESVVMLRCVECQTVFTSPAFNTSQSAIHCFEFCFSSEARLTYTLIFLLLPIIFYLTEFLTLTDRSSLTIVLIILS